MVTATRELTVITKQYKEYPIEMIQKDDGSIEFIANGVCKALGIKHMSSALRAIPSDEKGMHRMHTPGGMQDMVTLTESGRYRLTMRCDKPEAKPFQDWVVKEVLPSIRKTGSYIDFVFGQRATAPASDNALAEAINNMTTFLKSIDARVSALESKPAGGAETAVAVLDSLIPEISTRLKISQVIRRFVARQSNGYSHQDAFDKLYYEYKYRYHVDLKERAKNAKATSIMDYAEYTDVKEGTHYVDELYGLAQLLFPEN